MPQKHNLETIISVTMADIVTDFMVISIPILLLRKSQLRLSQNLRILTFLCLNIFLVGFSLIRVIRSLPRVSKQYPIARLDWLFLWLHLEPSTAVIMGGVTAFRTIFASHNHGQQGRNSESRRRLSNYRRLQQLFKRLGSSRSEPLSGDDVERNLPLPKTRGTLNGLKTFIRRHRREPGNTTAETWNESTLHTLDSYHAFQKQEVGAQVDVNDGSRERIVKEVVITQVRQNL
jgi:hypothetical protein